MDKDALITQIRKQYTLAAGTLDERGRRTLAASEALAVGWGGITLVARATGLSRATIGLGVKELLRANRKTREGGDHPDRDAQFAHITATAQAFLAAGEPVISVDAKKKELVGDFKNGGRGWRPQGQPEEVRVHDFKLPSWGA